MVLKLKSTKLVSSFKGSWFWWGVQLSSRSGMSLQKSVSCSGVHLGSLLKQCWEKTGPHLAVCSWGMDGKENETASGTEARGRTFRWSVVGDGSIWPRSWAETNTTISLMWFPYCVEAWALSRFVGNLAFPLSSLWMLSVSSVFQLITDCFSCYSFNFWNVSSIGSEFYLTFWLKKEKANLEVWSFQFCLPPRCLWNLLVQGLFAGFFVIVDASLTSLARVP